MAPKRQRCVQQAAPISPATTQFPGPHTAPQAADRVGVATPGVDYKQAAGAYSRLPRPGPRHKYTPYKWVTVIAFIASYVNGSQFTGRGGAKPHGR
jgi:hypothetical protein